VEWTRQRANTRLTAHAKTWSQWSRSKAKLDPSVLNRMGGFTSTPLSLQDARIDREADATARCLVWRIQAMVARIKKDDPQAYDTVQALSFNEVQCIAKRMLIAREEFRVLDKPTKVTLGYHYTEKANMASIRKHGLMNQQERASKKVMAVKTHGTVYGPGIYTTTNRCAFRGVYGDVGLVVVSLPGNNGDYTERIYGNHDSGTVNRHCTDEIVILSCAKQCIPVLQFASHQAFDKGNLLLERYHAEL
jgi:hypothetical protein